MASLNDEAVTALLQAPYCAVISTNNGDGSILSAVAWISLEDGVLAVNSAEGRRWPANLDRDGHVTALVYSQENPYEFVSIVGKAARATDGDDFVGVQCYTRMHFGPDGQAPNDPAVPVTQMGDELWPQAIEHTVRRAAAVSGRPVVVTENGIATADDTERIAFLSDALRSAHRCLEEGIDLRGYFVWSLMDNFEWADGYQKRFGLYHVDFKTQRRTPKLSASFYREVIQRNAVM